MRYVSALVVLIATFIAVGSTPRTYVDATADGADGYVGETTCLGCHENRDADLVDNYMASGHRYKLNPVTDGQPRAYPGNRMTREGAVPAAVTPPAGSVWADFAYVIGGYGWKARFVRLNGRVYTDDDQAQQNLFATVENGAKLRTTYHLGEDKKYDYNCFKCHTTGATPVGSWNGVPADELGTFSDPGVTCEGCHGPGEDHVAGAFQSPPVLPPNTGEVLATERCIDCHQRGGPSNAVLAKGGYIRHHEQGNEFRASAHGDGMNADLTCVTCHNTHNPLHFPELGVIGGEGLGATCETCHESTYPMPKVNGVAKSIECVDCHMPKAAKSALGFTLGNGYKGDVSSHLMAINTDPVGRDAMFTQVEDLFFVALDDDGHGASTMDFACLGCHTTKSIGWAAAFADALHSGAGVTTATEDLETLPMTYQLEQNYPNPFNPTTTVAFSLPETADVNLMIYSLDGRFLGSVLSQRMPAGAHQVTLNADFLSSGLYIYELRAGEFSATKTMTVLK